jgi:hypothetical protein
MVNLSLVEITFMSLVFEELINSLSRNNSKTYWFENRRGFKGFRVNLIINMLLRYG